MFFVFYFGNWDIYDRDLYSKNGVKISLSDKTLKNIWLNYMVLSVVSNICLNFEYPIFDSIVFWNQLDVRQIQILLKNHDAEGIDYLQTKTGKYGRRKIETASRQDYDENVRRYAFKRQIKKQTQTENDMIAQVEHVVDESDRSNDDDDDIIVANIHKQTSADAMEKQDMNPNKKYQ